MKGDGHPGGVAFAQQSGSAELMLPSTVDAPGLARAHVARHAQRLPAALLDDALLLVSELVTNAVMHGRPAIMLGVRDELAGIGVSITDHGQALPRLPTTRPDDTATGGRGLFIVDSLATQWGVTNFDSARGKTVWFHLDPT